MRWMAAGSTVSRLRRGSWSALTADRAELTPSLRPPLPLRVRAWLSAPRGAIVRPSNMEDPMDVAPWFRAPLHTFPGQLVANVVPLAADRDAIAAARSDRCILLTGAPAHA